MQLLGTSWTAAHQASLAKVHELGEKLVTSLNCWNKINIKPKFYTQWDYLSKIKERVTSARHLYRILSPHCLTETPITAHRSNCLCDWFMSMFDRKQQNSVKQLLFLLLLLSRFSCVRLCVTPEMAAHQAPPSLGFTRQEHWSGLPFPSPMHESEKWKWSRSVVSDS